MEPVRSLSCSGTAELVQHPWGCSEMLQEHRLPLVLPRAAQDRWAGGVWVTPRCQDRDGARQGPGQTQSLPSCY